MRHKSDVEANGHPFTADIFCWHDNVPDPPPAHLTSSCAQAGVLGILPCAIGILQATELVKILLGQSDVLNGR